MSKTILITGANRGIGLELVKQYVRNGCAILACCRDPDNASELELLQRSYPAIMIYQLDVSDEISIKKLAHQLKDTAIDILFNNAGMAGQNNPFGNIVYEDLITTFKTNTLGPIMLAQELYQSIVAGDVKMIVNISSELASIELNQVDDWFWLSYRISKSALNAATRSLANQLKASNITVIALNPGWVQTDMGGKNADITVEESVTGIKKVLENVSLSDSGQFLAYDGRMVPW